MVYSSKISHLLAGSLFSMSSVRIHLFPFIASQRSYKTHLVIHRFFAECFGQVYHIELFRSDKYLNLKKNVKAKIDSSKVIDPWRNVDT